MKKIFFALLTIAVVTSTNAQTNKTWNGKQCAVVLTYDDGLNVHLNNVIPALDSMKFKGTFYICDHDLNAQIAGWRKAAVKGHELANHTIWHPCTGGAGRDFVKDYDLRFYTVKRMVDEIREMNNMLKAIDGKTKRTFAFPCGDQKIHDTAYIDPLKNDFVAARGVQFELLPVDKVDLYDIRCFGVSGQTGDQLIELVKQAEQKNALLVFLFHGVGGEHSINVSLEAHSKLLHYLKQKQKDIWVAPMLDVAEYVKKYQSKNHS